MGYDTGSGADIVCASAISVYYEYSAERQSDDDRIGGTSFNGGWNRAECELLPVNLEPSM